MKTPSGCKPDNIFEPARPFNYKCLNAIKIMTSSGLACCSQVGFAQNQGSSTTILDNCFGGKSIADNHLWCHVKGTGHQMIVSTCHSETMSDICIAVYSNVACAATMTTSSECMPSIPICRDGHLTGGKLAASNADTTCREATGTATVAFNSEKDSQHKLYVSQVTNDKITDNIKFALTVKSPHASGK